jgi:hypothetical protein
MPKNACFMLSCVNSRAESKDFRHFSEKKKPGRVNPLGEAQPWPGHYCCLRRSWAGPAWARCRHHGRVLSGQLRPLLFRCIRPALLCGLPTSGVSCFGCSPRARPRCGCLSGSPSVPVFLPPAKDQVVVDRLCGAVNWVPDLVANSRDLFPRPETRPLICSFDRLPLLLRLYCSSHR